MNLEEAKKCNCPCVYCLEFPNGMKYVGKSKNLSKSGAYIPGVRPGNDTIEYVSTVLSKLTIVGSLFLVIIAGLPIVFPAVSGLDSSITIGGTGLLIVVGVAIETYKQLESSLISRSHRAGIKR